MKKMRILISGDTHMDHYSDAIEAAGGEAICKYLPEVCTDYDGLLLSGGNDMDPKYYGQEINGSVEIKPERDAAEYALLKAFVEAGKPVLGICRGHQLINVFFGGTLHQDIPEKKLHRCTEPPYGAHNITAVKGSVLHKLYGDEFVVNSIHHQAVDRLGENLIPTAYWNSTYVEAFEHRNLPVYGVQFHPERMCVRFKREDAINGLPFFQWFIQLCEKQKA